MHYSEKSILQDGWSIKDSLAHITEWELAMIRCLNTSLHGEIPNQPLFGLPEEEVIQINAEYYQRNIRIPIGQVLDEAQDSYQLILVTMRRVTEYDLFEPRRFDWLAGKPFWPIVAANTCWHYEEHREEFENAINKSSLQNFYFHFPPNSNTPVMSAIWTRSCSRRRKTEHKNK